MASFFETLGTVILYFAILFLIFAKITEINERAQKMKSERERSERVSRFTNDEEPQ